MKRYKRLLFRLAYYPSIWIAKPINILAHGLYNKMIYKILSLGGVKFYGFPRFISLDVYIDSFDHVSLGGDIVISSNVIFLTHDYSVTTALVAANKRPKGDIKLLGRIDIGKNVFIGMKTTLLPGTTIGDNVIIGAGSIVKGKIPSNSVAAGNPCRVIMTIEEYLSRKEKVWSDLELCN